MIRPERDPHWLLGVEHGVDGLEPYTFQDAENQRRYLEGYGRGRIRRQALLAAHPYQQAPSALNQQLMQQGPLVYGGPIDPALRPGGPWKP